jgi:cytochrome c oxidase cbb3-type subunit 3
MSFGWSLYVNVLVLGTIAASLWLLFWQRKQRVAKGETVGHDFDGIQELDNPLPRWWLGIFLGSAAFALVYLVLYPGLGSFAGVLGWSQRGQYDAEVDFATRTYGPIYAELAAMPFPSLILDDRTARIGGRLFANNCSTCHGADARGGSGFPDLTDADWLYGGDAETIEKSILDGRNGYMPPFAPALGGEDGVREVIAYVRSLSGNAVDPAAAEAGKKRYGQICIACHGLDGKGMAALGAPNLTDDVWLYGGSEAAIAKGLHEGRQGKMPPHRALLGAERAKILAAYVASLSRSGSARSGP